ncbi:MAG: hypothetical protein HC904_04190 [Blastochloris sp.]|nr:hypothetical protein [Blastochloris sp.]
MIGVGVAGHPLAAAGNTWAFLQWVLGFRELGWEVWMVEGLAGDQLIDERWQKGVAAEGSENVRHWRAVCERFGLASRASLLIDDAAENLEELRDFARSADVFLNVSGHFKGKGLEFPRARKLYLDLDPGFTQIWAETYGVDMNFAGHDVFFSYGTRLGREGCRAPTCGIEWQGVLPPVVLSQWPVQPRQGSFEAFSTLAHWQGYKWCEWQGAWYTGKSEEFHRLKEVPGSVPARMELATEVEANAEELKAFAEGGWCLVDGVAISRSFESYVEYLRKSSAEFSAAKGGYVLSQGGWFSDRSVCYLASGRPVVLQATGIEERVGSGRGLRVFRSPEEAIRECREVLENHEQEQKAARELAETFFDSRVVIQDMLGKI